MKKFLKNIIGFILTILILFVSILLTTNFIVNNNANFKLDNNITHIIVGNSHSECSFNDSIITNCSNLSLSGESYLYTFFKTKKIIELNNIKNITIEFTNIQIHSTNNEWIWGDEPFSKRFPIFSPFFDFNTHVFLLRKNIKQYINGTLLTLNKNLSKIILNNYSYKNKIGGFKKLTKQFNFKNYKEKEVESFLKNNSKTDISFTNLHWLKKIIILCENKNINVNLVRSPQHLKYFLRKNESDFQLIKKLFFNEVEFIDLNNFKLNNTDFADLGHLNFNGSKKTSIHFNNLK
ncbi:MAG: hypothetical protein CL853_05860 [Crocinitomicaceae bacterium]|nr:hypothetical protein [Crocinitomicaceae bacterium]